MLLSIYRKKKPLAIRKGAHMVALPGLEPGISESKSGVLPLHHKAPLC